MRPASRYEANFFHQAWNNQVPRRRSVACVEAFSFELTRRDSGLSGRFLRAGTRVTRSLHERLLPSGVKVSEGVFFQPHRMPNDLYESFFSPAIFHPRIDRTANREHGRSPASTALRLPPPRGNRFSTRVVASIRRVLPRRGNFRPRKFRVSRARN